MLFGWLLLAAPLAGLVIVAAILVWRRPALGLGVLALGIAFHNAVIMILLDLDTPGLVVRGIQAWKELILLVLVVKVGSEVVEGGNLGLAGLRSRLSAIAWPVRVLDAIAISFTLLLLIYLAAPFVSTFGSETTVAQRILSFRIFIMIPLLYTLGRIVGARDRDGSRISVDLVVIAAALVAVFGLIELWFIRTRFWLDFGANQFTAWQGFAPRGPGGLPENFFQSTSESSGLRRMVSTYISPLGIAYTALLIVPLIVGVLVAVRRPRGWYWLALGLVLVSLSLSVTRLALLCLVVEAVLWVIVTRRPAAVIAAALAVAAVGVGFWIYPRVGPLVSFDLVDVRPPAGAALIEQFIPGGRPDEAPVKPQPSGPAGPDIVDRILTQQDASIQNHIAAVQHGLMFAVQHPFGVGLGSTMPRFGTPTGPAESAFLGIVGELGLLGGALFAALYAGLVLLGLIVAWRQLSRPRMELALLVGVGGIGLVPIVMTSAVWSDLSVTYLFWWAAGATVSVAGRRVRPLQAGDEPLPSERQG